MRYIILAACVLLQVCLGGLYAWSSFVPALQGTYGLSSAQTQLIFGAMIAVFTIAMVFSGRMLERRGPRLLAGIGAVLFGLGYVIGSFSGGSFAGLFLGIGVVAGIGTGFGYVVPLATGMRWFPNHRGLVTGLAVAGFGGGAVLLSSVAEVLFAQGMGVLTIFRWTGIAYGALILLIALVLRFPPKTHAAAAAHSTIRVRTLVRDPFFAALAVAMFCGTFAGLLVIGNLKPLALASGVTPVQAALAISIFAAGNASGRIAWGWLTDRFGQRTVALSLVFLAMSLAVFGFATASSAAAVMGMSFVVGFGFGACFIVYAAQVASRYGARGIGSVYPLIFLAYGAAGIAGPWVGGWLFDLTGSYEPGIAVSVALLLAGLPACMWLLSKAASTGRAMGEAGQLATETSE